MSGRSRSGRLGYVLAGALVMGALAAWWLRRPPADPREVVRKSWAEKGVEKPNVLLITLDTTRADHLGAYGYLDVETPNIDALARRGVLFAQATSPAPLTLPAHASIMTGTYPTYHGVRVNGNTALSPAQIDDRRDAEAARLRHGSLGRGVRAGRALGPQPRLRRLRRPLRPREVQAPGSGKRPATGQRGRGRGARLARRRTSRDRSSRGSISTTRTLPTSPRSPFAPVTSRAASAASTTERSPSPISRSGAAFRGCGRTGSRTAPSSS